MSGTQPVVSIITVTFNSEKTLEETIRSVVQQSYSNIEYIIVDGGSTDGTLKIVEKYSDRVSKWVSEPDRGIHFALNKGFAMASGDIVFCLASDDLLYDSSVVQTVVDAFCSRSDLKLVYGNVMVFDPILPDLYVMGHEVVPDRYKKTHFTKSDYEKGLVPHFPGLFFKRELVLELGGFNEDYLVASDIDLMARFFKMYHDQALYLDQNVSRFREGGISSNPRSKNIGPKELQVIVRNHFGLEISMPETDVQDYFRLWVQWLSVEGRCMADILKARSIERVAIYGSRKTAIILARDFISHGISVECFIDKDRNKRGFVIDGIPVRTPQWMGDEACDVQAIILSIEGNHDQKIRESVTELVSDKPIQVWSWKDLLHFAFKI